MANLVHNGGFENAPTFVAPTSSAGVWIDGTAGGSPSNDTYGWGLGASGGFTTGTFAASFDNSTSNNGTYSLHVAISATGSSCAINPFAGALSVANLSKYCARVNPLTSYTCVVYIKTNVTSGSATTGTQVWFQEESSTAVLQTNHPTTSITTTTGWTKYALTFTTGSITNYIYPELIVKGNDGTGTLIMDAWFDDMYIDDHVVNFVKPPMLMVR